MTTHDDGVLMQGTTAFAANTFRSFLGGRCTHAEQCAVDPQRATYLRGLLAESEPAGRHGDGGDPQTRPLRQALRGRCVVLAEAIAWQDFAEKAAGYVGLLADYGDRDRMSVAGAWFDAAGRRLTVIGWITELPAGEEELAVATFYDPPEPAAAGIQFHPAIQRRRFADPGAAIAEFAVAAGLRRGWTEAQS